MKWLELLQVPSGARDGRGAPLSVYQRIPLPQTGLDVARAGPDIILPTLAPEQACVVGERNGIVAFLSAGPQLGSVSDGFLHLWAGDGPFTARVVTTDTVLPGWPELLCCAAVENSPATASSLDVLADALLEADHPLGSYMRGLEPGSAPERKWLLHLAQRVDRGNLELTFDRGLIRSAVLRGRTPCFDALAKNALFHLVREVDLICAANEALVSLQELSAARLPWLERLTVHHSTKAQQKQIEREQKRWKAAFPRAVLEFRFETVMRVRRGSGEVVELGPKDQIRLGVGDVMRWWRGLPSLMVMGGPVLLNGRRYEKTDTMVMLDLKPGDVVQLGDETVAVL